MNKIVQVYYYGIGTTILSAREVIDEETVSINPEITLNDLSNKILKKAIRMKIQINVCDNGVMFEKIGIAKNPSEMHLKELLDSKN